MQDLGGGFYEAGFVVVEADGVGGTVRMLERVRPGGGSSVWRRRIVRALVVSFVWEESMRAMSVWKRRSFGRGGVS